MLATHYFEPDKRAEHGSFWLLDNKADLVCLEEETGNTPNGIRFSPQLDKLYFAVTDHDCVYVYDYDKEKGISVYIDTCGFVKQEIIESIIPFTDKFLYDIKAIDSNVHKKCTGRDNQLILENLKFLSERNCKIEIRYPLVKGYNDCECDRIGEFLSNKKGIEKVKVLQYHHFAASRYQALGMKNTLPNTETTYEDVENAVKILKNYGLNAVNGMIEK